MVAVFICDGRKKEIALLSSDCRNQIAYLSKEDIRLGVVPDDNTLIHALQEDAIMHLLYYSFEQGQQTEGLRIAKKKSGDTMVMLITDPHVSPLEYLRPGIAPDALILRPLSNDQLKQANMEFLSNYFEREREKKGHDSFIIETRQERIVIPYASIYYFEAREKKLFLRTKNEEQPFYGTIGELETQLPEYFRRTHRSFIVNIKKARRLIITDGYLLLIDNITVPVSRSYSNALKEALE